ncbi:MAG: hypothetical protein RJA70_492 [Pseudomonadota bacterium]|jgi:beta-lactamase regulating signal transducer with metallopeptidase domain
MSPAAQGAQLFLLAGLAFLALGTLASAALVRLCRTKLSRWEPRSRHRALVGLAALPVLTALALVFAVSLPSIIALIVPGLDHCAEHDHGHAHLCFIHLPKVGIHLGLMLGLLFLLSYAVLRALFAASSIARALRVVASLARTSEQRPELGISLIESSLPVCLAAGLLRPRVLVSRGLFNSLTRTERAVVIAHEQAHVRRRDAFVACLVRAFAVVHLPQVACWLVNEVEIAAEQACDEAAALAVGDRLAVAAAILRVERALQGGASAPSTQVAAAFGARAVTRRVEALLSDPTPPQSLRALTVAASVALGSVLLLATELHHLTESVLSRIAH